MILKLIFNLIIYGVILIVTLNLLCDKEDI
jgi:hypothetical protein